MCILTATNWSCIHVHDVREVFLIDKKQNKLKRHIFQNFLNKIKIQNFGTSYLALFVYLNVCNICKFIIINKFKKHKFFLTLIYYNITIMI